MMGLEGVVLIPLLILGSAAILYYGLLNVRGEQLRRRSESDNERR